ncbi:putative translational repressor [Wickerhamomyces ciferrii]|uniref:Translational repressor n=1 Tax=Wickerhamomyces ciferrii (strain ATCC 14091 / BCRC 22168 / CBS 111 / JCM 3599 / NBRC 0793 / NRRL Y-1031 F-60-10) TaxID=1206466 RepID=K0K7K0_WICCF|nr:putative translational repressor [Wickerhamomyces ciferrii]CCH40775.1 putative translational repressor [Wickerhamomyces ciferrii]
MVSFQLGVNGHRANHQPNLSINSVNSVVEPLTPPDLGDQTFNSSVFTSTSNGPSTASSTPLSNLNNNIGGNTYRSRFKSLPLVNELDQKFSQINISNLQNLSQPSQSNQVQTPLQSNNVTPTLNNSNNNFTKNDYFMNPLNRGSNGSIPQISLQQYHQNASGLNLSNVNMTNAGMNMNMNNMNLNNYNNGLNRTSPPPIGHTNGHSNGNQQQPPIPQRQKSQPILLQNQHQHHSSLPAVHFNSQPQTPKVEIPNYKNYDELNLIPIESLDILKLSVDQYGCRFLQKKLDLDVSIKDVIFNKIFNNLIDLIINPFGNYLIQKLIDYLSNYQKDLLIEKIHTYLFLISINQYGTRSLQKIIDKVSNTYQIDLIIKGLQINDVTNGIDDNNIVKLIKDLNGNHVIQKCIFKFPPEKFQFIIDSICINNNIVRISTHKHGCCVLQKLLNNANFNQILNIAKMLLIYLDDLINDQFGNYIIQFLFELNFLKTSKNISFLIDEFFNKIYNNLIQLSCLKFSSNVVEKFIKILKFKQNYLYLTEIIKLVDYNFELLIKDKFGNYVIQTLIDQFYDVSELSSEMNKLIVNIKSYLPAIKSAPYARKIQLKIQQLETNYSMNNMSSTNSSLNSFHDQNNLNNNFKVTTTINPHHHINSNDLNNQYTGLESDPRNYKNPYITNDYNINHNGNNFNNNQFLNDGAGHQYGIQNPYTTYNPGSENQSVPVMNNYTTGHNQI